MTNIQEAGSTKRWDTRKPKNFRDKAALAVSALVFSACSFGPDNDQPTVTPEPTRTPNATIEPRVGGTILRPQPTAESVRATITPAARVVETATPVPVYENARTVETQDAPVSSEVRTASYDIQWLRSVAQQPNAIDQINIAWEATTNWKAGQAGAGTYDVPANSVVIGSKNAGNDPSFISLAPNIWFTGPGGRFGSSEGYRSFQLDGAIEQAKDTPKSVAEMIARLKEIPEYADKIATLDMEFANNPSVIDRWGTSGPLEVMTAEQLAMLQEANSDLQPIVQVLLGNTIVWGELAPGDQHKGLEKISDNIYRTTGEGGIFVTHRGFRAVRFPN